MQDGAGRVPAGGATDGAPRAAGRTRGERRRPSWAALLGGALLLGAAAAAPARAQVPALAQTPAAAPAAPGVGANTPFSGQLAPGAPEDCKCVTERPTEPPWVPPTQPPPLGPPGTPPSGGRSGLAALGAAGIALLAGIPLGSALQPALPFRPVVAELATPAVPAAQPLPPLPEAVPLPITEVAAGVLAPDTASHLPLLLAVGIAAIAAGVALLRDRRRRRRRRRWAGLAPEPQRQGRG